VGTLRRSGVSKGLAQLVRAEPSQAAFGIAAGLASASPAVTPGAAEGAPLGPPKRHRGRPGGRHSLATGPGADRLVLSAARVPRLV
jgi:hypothetical protein